MSNQALQLPAMRGVMGDWVYYVTLLPFREVSDRIKKTTEVHSSKLLRELIQRALTPRSKKIAVYLRSQPQRFFNAIVVGVYDGEPQWHQLSVRSSELFDPASLEDRVAESLGILTLRGDEKLFAIDGQHRVEGIKEFLEENDQVENLEDEICTIFVAHSSKPAAKLQRTRRLFATLNRYAKPVSTTEIIALDEDDVVAMACRDLLENHRLFKGGRVATKNQKNLPPADKTNITSLVALYQSMDTYLMDRAPSSWGTFKSVRPVEESTVQKYIVRAHRFWTLLANTIPEIKSVETLKPDEPLAAGLRGVKGGDLFFRPIAPPMIVRGLKKAEKLGMQENEFIKRFARIPRKLGKPPWLGLLWDGANMITGDKNQKLAEDLILWMVNCDPLEKKIRASDLKRRLGEVLNKEPEDCILPKKLA
jgi:DNA sulfur modification protein DndB